MVLTVLNHVMLYCTRLWCALLSSSLLCSTHFSILDDTVLATLLTGLLVQEFRKRYFRNTIARMTAFEKICDECQDG